MTSCPIWVAPGRYVPLSYHLYYDYLLPSSILLISFLPIHTQVLPTAMQSPPPLSLPPYKTQTNLVVFSKPLSQINQNAHKSLPPTLTQVALSRVEREVLLKVVGDFHEQLGPATEGERMVTQADIAAELMTQVREGFYFILSPFCY